MRDFSILDNNGYEIVLGEDMSRPGKNQNFQLICSDLI